MNYGLLAPDEHGFPNFALLKLSAYLKTGGHNVEWAQKRDLFGCKHYDTIFASKIFTFTPDFDRREYDADNFVLGGTGYDIKSTLPQEIENSKLTDYSIYPQYNFSIQFTSRGCIRHCPFCLVHDKEGGITPVEPVDLNPRGEWIEVLDNNFFANPEWREAVKYYKEVGQPIKLHGVDIRIMDEEQAYALKSMKHYRQPHIAWDLPKTNLIPQLKAMAKYIRPTTITCYVLIGFNSTIEEDLFRVRTLKDMGYTPFVQPYRDFSNIIGDRRTWYQVDFARWANNHFFLKSCDFEDFEPRKGFKCGTYLKHPELLTLKFDKKCPPPIL